MAGWTVLKNKRYHGSVTQQTVRTPLPLVQELSGVRDWGRRPRPQMLLREVASRRTTPGRATPHARVRRLEGGRIEARVDLPELVRTLPGHAHQIRRTGNCLEWAEL